jgi:hypothetical protein
VDHHPYHDGHWNRPPEGEHWGWQDRERWNRGYDPWFFEHSPNYESWNPIIRAEARQIADLLDEGNTAAAMTLLNAELYDLRYDRYAQNELLRDVSEFERFHRLHLDRWDPDAGTWGNIDVTPPPPPVPPDQPPDQPPPPEPAPVPLPAPPQQDDPWMQLEGNVISTLLDDGDSNAAATRLSSDLYALRGNLDAQNTLLGMVDSNDRKGTGTDLKLGNWNPDTGTYDTIEVLPALTDPGDGTPINTYPDADAPAPDGLIDTSKSNDATDPWQHQEIAVIAALLDAGDSRSAATKLTSDLQLLAGDLDSQNAIISQVAASLANTGSSIQLGDWDATTGTYSSIEILSAGQDPGNGIPIKVYPDANAFNNRARHRR